MKDWWNQIFLNNKLHDWGIALLIISLSILGLRLIQSVVINRINAFSQKTKTTIDDFIVKLFRSTVMPLLYVWAFSAGLAYLKFSPRIESVIHIAVLVTTTFFILKAISSFLSYSFHKALSGHEHNEQREKQSKGILFIIQSVIWAAGILFLVDNLGYDITTIVAGLGIGGIAIALAAQTILGDLFGYLVIFFDKPFEIGDFVIFEDKMGTVEYVGIKTTRIRTLGGEQLICANSDLTNSRLHNYKRMQERRIVFGFGVEYKTPEDKLQLIPELVKKIVETTGLTRFDRAHFKSFGNFSLDFEVVYFVLSPDYNTYMDIQQVINLQLFSAFKNEGIFFAFPTQTLLLHNAEDNISFHKQPV